MFNMSAKILICGQEFKKIWICVLFYLDLLWVVYCFTGIDCDFWAWGIHPSRSGKFFPKLFHRVIRCVIEVGCCNDTFAS